MHQRKCKKSKKEVCNVYNYDDSHAYGYKQSGILFWLDSMDGNGLVLV
jgi:hypothetical protein